MWAASRGYTLAWLALLAVQGLLPAVTVYLTRPFVDSLVQVIGADLSWEAARPVLLIGGAIVGVLVLTEVLGSALEWVRAAQAELLQDHAAALVHEKATEVDLAFYELPHYHDRLERARGEGGNRSLALLEGTGSLLQNGLTLLAMGTLLVPYGLWMPAVLVASTLPALYVTLKVNRRYHQWWQRTTEQRRWTRYYDWILAYSGAAAEIRLFGLGLHFRSAFQAVRKVLRDGRLRLLRNQGIYKLGASAASLLIAGAAFAWMVWRALQGAVTLGDLALFYQAFNRGQGLMRAMLGNLSGIHSSSLFLADLFDFLDTKPSVASPERPSPVPLRLAQTIRFRDVTFSYPGSAVPVLDGFSLEVPAGRTVAIVGPNGAGKSTLLKLLCRFYDPDRGSIELDGVDLQEFSAEELRRRITVLFQFPVPYHATARDNIALGDLSSGIGQTQVENAARAAGAHEFIARLPQGYDSMLGKWFSGGTELSGGEWQRLALARAFARNAPIVVLDEPTSFMDSWAEMEWMERFRRLAQGRTVILITHRFTTAMRADIICVMDKGRIVESGSHQELLAQNGMYAASWTAQMNSATTSLNEGDRPYAPMTGAHADGSEGWSVERQHE